MRERGGECVVRQCRKREYDFSLGSNRGEKTLGELTTDVLFWGIRDQVRHFNAHSLNFNSVALGKYLPKGLWRWESRIFQPIMPSPQKRDMDTEWMLSS